jgi:DNA-binding response OmpR family regulator
VLVVDADAQIRELLEDLLKAEDYEVSLARDVRHASGSPSRPGLTSPFST